MIQSHFTGFKSFLIHSYTGEWKYPRLDMCCTAPDLVVEMEQFAWSKAMDISVASIMLST